MYCKHCFRQVKDTDKYCDNCGEPITENGGIPRPTPVVQTTVVTQNDNTKKILIAVIVVLVLVLAVGITYVLSNDRSQTKISDKSEKEAIIKPNVNNDDETIEDEEVEPLTVAPSTVNPSVGVTESDKEAFGNLVNLWDEYHNNCSSYQLKELYAPTVMFYGKTLSRTAAMDINDKFFMQHPDFYQDSRDIQMEELNNGDVLLEFTKEVTIDDNTKEYPCYLILRRTSANDIGWCITTESDKITDRNLLKYK